jgi:hypothetical protein
MAIQLPYPVLSNPISKSEIEANQAALVAKLGAVTSSDLDATAGLLSTQLAAPYQEMWVRLQARGTWPGGNAILDSFVLPNDAPPASSLWYVDYIMWVCTDIGDGAGTFDIQYGAYNGLGIWTSAATIATATTISGAPANTGFQGNVVPNVGTVTPTNPFSSFALRSTNAGVGVLSGAQDTLTVVINLRRYLTAR